jgi:hypothetical protein
MTTTTEHWNNAVVTGSNIDGARIEPFKGFDRRGVTRRAGCWGKLFPTSDEAWAWLLEHGFTQEYYGRPYAFIDLRLSPATRRYLKSKPAAQRWDILAFLLGDDGHRAYFRAMRHDGCMAERRDKWSRYMAGEWGVFEQPRVKSAYVG